MVTSRLCSAKGLVMEKHIIISSYDRPGNPYYNGGGAAVMEQIAVGLAAKYKVTFVTAAHRGPVVRKESLHYRELPIGWAGPRGGQLLFHLVLPFLTRRIPHHLWIENFTPPFSTSFIPLYSDAHVIGVAQSLSGTHMTKTYKLPFFLVERFGLRLYRHLIVLTTADEAKLRRFTSPKATIRVIPNGAPLPDIDEQSLGGGDHILFLGRIDVKHKGLDLLISAYQRSGVKLPLLIAGSGTSSEERKLADLLADAGDNIQWVGRVSGPHKEDLLARSAFMVMPSRVEAFGISALEAMSYGKPVVHFDLATLNWLSGNVRVPPEDMGALSAAICDLTENEQRRRNLALEARTGAYLFSEESITERYLEFVEEILNSQEGIA
jgi:glycosyltransferase involved in cell wall biosynthesis